MSSTNISAVGVDLGSMKTMIVADDGEIIRTSTGSISRSTLISIGKKKRLFGEDALAQVTAEGTIELLNLLIGRSEGEVKAITALNNRKISISEDAEGRLVAEINYRGNTERVHVAALLAMFLAHINDNIKANVGDDTTLCFPLPPNSSPNITRAIKEAAVIAGLDANKIFTANAADCLAATYARKVVGLGGSQKINLQDKVVLLVDMGHVQTTVVAVKYSAENADHPEIVAVGHDLNLGAYHFDLQLFDHFSTVIEGKYKTKIEHNTKRGQRLLAGCERIRKLLSQLNESQITIERLVDEIDVPFALKREEMYAICVDLLTKFKELVQSVIVQAWNKIDAVEIVGGGVRMPIVQQTITSFVGENIPLGAKLDDGSVALGAALLYRKQQAALNTPPPVAPATPVTENAAGETSESVPIEVEATSLPTPPSPEPQPTVGLTEEEILVAKQREVIMQQDDLDVKKFHDAYNQVESYILEMRNAPRLKFGNLINASELNRILDDIEGWLWDNTADDAVTPATTQDLLQKAEELKNTVQSLCAAYFEAVETEKKRVEDSLNEEAQKAAAEREANGEDGDEDHDTRKLKKADRMRMVVKNKEEGTELFKGGNIRPAAARYQKALTHCMKFFDLSADDEKEVAQLKLSLYLNLASCYLKLENWEQVLRNCTDALAIDAKSVKALFRRSSYYEHMKDYEKALGDLKLCEEYNPTEDKLVTKSMERVKKEILKLKEKEKKMWGKAFA